MMVWILIPVWWMKSIVRFTAWFVKLVMLKDDVSNFLLLKISVKLGQNGWKFCAKLINRTTQCQKYASTHDTVYHPLDRLSIRRTLLKWYPARWHLKPETVGRVRRAVLKLLSWHPIPLENIFQFSHHFFEISSRPSASHPKVCAAWPDWCVNIWPSHYVGFPSLPFLSLIFDV